MRCMPSDRIESFAGRNKFVFPVHRRDNPRSGLNSIQRILARDARHGHYGKNDAEREKKTRVRQFPCNPQHDSVGLDQLHRPDLTNNLRELRIA
jgi:hypothetical protein